MEQRVKFGLRIYNKSQNNRQKILEHIDEKGFITQIIFDKNNFDKTKEEVDNDLIQKLLKH
jgi:hypothetical protein